MDPITLAILAKIALAVIAVAIVVEIAILTFEEIAQRFNSLKTGDVDEIGFTVKNALESGQVEVIQGVFNKRTNEVVNNKVIKIQAGQLDEQVENAHRENQVVLYT